MTRTGALVWKEWRDHRVAAFVFAALVPLVSWPVQRWIFKFAEPDWTWKWIIPLCVGLAVAVVAADSFAMDLATSRMASFVALPTTLRRHFATRTLFLGLVALGIAAWTAATNLAIVGCWGPPGAVGRHLDTYDAAAMGLAVSAAGAGAVLVFSSLGVGGFRAVLGGALLAGVAFFATDFAFDRLVKAPDPWRSKPGCDFLLEWVIAAATLFGAAFLGFVGSRANPASRQRGTVLVGLVLVTAFGLPAGTAAWNAYRGWRIEPNDPELSLEAPTVSPDGRYVAVIASKQGQFSGRRSWIVRVEDGRLFDWPRRNELIYGWSKDGHAWVVVEQQRPQSGEFDYGRLARVESGDTVGAIVSLDIGKRVEYGWSHGARWCQWLRWNCEPTKTPKTAPRGVSSWTLWSKDDEKTKRVVEARSNPAPTTKLGEVLIATPENQLALLDLAGGEPRVVADDVVGLHGALAGSPDGRFFTVSTSKGEVVLDATTWKPAAGPFGRTFASWCPDHGALLSVIDGHDGRLERLVDVADGREIVPDASLEVLGGYGCVAALDDGRLVARAASNRVLLLDADGKFIRRLFPPEE